MTRDLPIGNGHLLVNHDLAGNIRCIYYPHVGHENHALDHLSRFGVWVDGEFFWLGDSEINIGREYRDDSMVAHITVEHARLGLTLDIEDVVDHHTNVFIRRVGVRDGLGRPRSVRLFFHLDINLYGSQIANTCYFDPDLQSIIFYKGHRYISLSSGFVAPQFSVQCDGYACGQKGIHGLEGTWKDAEDGRLEGFPISQGSIDGVIQLNIDVEANQQADGWFWFCFGKSLDEVKVAEQDVRAQGPDDFLSRTLIHWKRWVGRDRHCLERLPKDIAEAYRRSLLIIRTNMDHDGAIVAANDSTMLTSAQDTYSYMWPRDGALIAHALDRSGYHDLTREFFSFCRRVMTSEGYLMHKYNPDGSVGASWLAWVDAKGDRQLPIQEDETALVLYALWNHYEVSDKLDDSLDDFEHMVIPAANFMVDFRDENGLPKPSYDLWEERFGVFAFTAASVYQGLLAAAKFAKFHGDEKLRKKYTKVADEIKEAIVQHFYDIDQGRFARALYPTMENGRYGYVKDMEPDSSLYALFDFEVLPANDDRIENTMRFLKEALWVPTGIGGIARYRNDRYYAQVDEQSNIPGNPWFICTLWYAEWLIARAATRADLDEAQTLLHWSVQHALPSGVMAEQLHPYTGEPLSVSPLTWSHATYVKVVQELIAAQERLEA